MGLRIGEFNTLDVLERVDFGFYLGTREEQVLLPLKWAPETLEVGDELSVFIYTDSEDRPIATTAAPHATVGEFACLEIVDTTKHGAFADWGLEKDLFIPFAQQKSPLTEGERHVVYVSLHERTQRVIGSTDLGRYFTYDLEGVVVGQEVSLLVFDFNDVGAQVVVNGQYRGIVYRNETYTKLQRGEKLRGWVKALRDDERLDISLQRLGHGATLDAKDVILEALHEAGGSLSLHDKSPPEEIRARLQMSKKVFKKAIGGLYKARRIEITASGIRLLSPPPPSQ